MNDAEYLAKANVAADVGETQSQDPAAVSDTQTQAQPTQTAEQKAIEMFEMGDQKYPANAEIKIVHNGQILKVPASKVLNTYRQFEHLQNKWANEYKPKIESFEKLRPEYEQAKAFKDKYGQIQEWSEKNPKDWETLWNLYQNKDKVLLESKVAPQQQSAFEAAQVGNTNNPNLKPLIDELTQIKAELSQYKTAKEQWEAKQQEIRAQKDTEFVMGEVDSFKKEYPEIDLEEVDPDGVKLWAKIMKFGIDNKLPDFETSAMKFLKPRLIDTWSSRARNEAVKGLKADNRQGIVKRSATPLQGQDAQAKIDPRKMSYGDIAELFKSGQFQGT